MGNVTEAQVSNLFKNLDTSKSSIGIPNKIIKIAAAGCVYRSTLTLVTSD